MLIRFKKRVSYLNAYPALCSGRGARGYIEAGAVREELPMLGCGVNPTDIEQVPDPRDDDLPATAGAVASECDNLERWLAAGYMTDPWQIAAQRIEQLIDAAVKLEMPDPPVIDRKGERSLRVALNKLRAWAVLHTKSGKSSGKLKRTGRPSKGEKGKDAIVIAALAVHHQYTSGRKKGDRKPGGSIGNYEPATVQGLGAKPGLSTAAVSRFFKEKFSKDRCKGYKGYVAACTRREIGLLLALNDEPLSVTRNGVFARGPCSNQHSVAASRRASRWRSGTLNTGQGSAACSAPADPLKWLPAK